MHSMAVKSWAAHASAWTLRARVSWHKRQYTGRGVKHRAEASEATQQPTRSFSAAVRVKGRRRGARSPPSVPAEVFNPPGLASTSD